eukprot:1054257-Rhodomonas_salina.1
MKRIVLGLRRPKESLLGEISSARAIGAEVVAVNVKDGDIITKVILGELLIDNDAFSVQLSLQRLHQTRHERTLLALGNTMLVDPINLTTDGRTNNNLAT